MAQESTNSKDACAPDAIDKYIDSCDIADLNQFEVLPKFYPDEEASKNLLNLRISHLPENHPLIGQSYRYLAHLAFQKKTI